MKFYTDHAFHILLGDELGKEAPIREIQILSQDEGVCHIVVEGQNAHLPVYLIYKESGRHGKVPHIYIEDVPSHL
jgi:hypothetical protein